MEAMLVIGLFLVNAGALFFLMKPSKTLSGVCNIIGLCLVVATAYQFELVSMIVPIVGMACVVLILIKVFLFKNKKEKIEQTEEV